MTPASARTTANLVLAAAGLTVAYVIITTPPLRRWTMRAAHVWLGATMPMYLWNEVRRAWMESATAA